MNGKQKHGTWKARPVNTPIVLRAYAVIFGLLGLMLLVWGPMWFGRNLAGSPFGGATLARVIGSLFIGTTCCAALLAIADDHSLRRRSLFWFAMGHVALWLALLAELKWVWGPGLGDQVVAVIGGTAFALYCLWLIAEGEFPQEPYGAVGFFAPPASTPSEPLRSEYERKIRNAAAQEERNRLARDLHDSIKQQIFAIQTAAATAQARFTGDASGVREALEQIRSSAREAMTEMEVMLDQLRAEPLENTGLVAALKKLCESIGFRTGAQVEFKLGSVPATSLAAPGAAEATLRVAQEALANVARHARASHVLVSLDSPENRMELTIQDDGAGFDINQDSRGMGTANMRARAEQLGGRLDLVSGREAGTTVKFSIPCAGVATSVNPSRYRNRTVALGLMLLTLFLNKSVGHWSLLPALAFVAAIAITHYWKAIRGVRRLSQPTL
jgi:signal transduction histidine kinase